MVSRQKKCCDKSYPFLLCSLLFSAIYTYSQTDMQSIDSESDEIGIFAGESPGEGYGPELLTDNESIGGVLSFVAPKGARCERLVIQLTPSAIKDNIQIKMARHDRVPNNHKWKEEKDEHHAFTIWDANDPAQPETRLISIEYNHAGHKGRHGGGTAKDTHHNWGIRLVKNNTYLTADPAQWKEYIRILFSSFRPSMENTYHGDKGIGYAHMTLHEAKKLSEWGFLSPTGKAIVSEIEDEINRLESNDLETVNPGIEESLADLGLALEKNENGQWLIWGTKSKIKGSTTHKCSGKLSIGGGLVSDRIIVKLIE